MIPRVKTVAEHTEAGRILVRDGLLKPLREELGLTRSAMAELLHISAVTYNRCEDWPETHTRMWQATAERLGRFAYLARITLSELEKDGWYLRELTPLHVCAIRYGLPQEVMLRWYREGRILAEDLGILGLWVHDADLHLLAEVK